MDDLNAPLVFNREMEKVATHDMPQDATMWDEEVMRHLHEEFPELTEDSLEVVFKKTDAKKGYGYGFVSLGNKGMIKVPIIIKEFKMFPLDVMLFNEKAYPLTADTVKEIVQSTAIGKSQSKPEEPFAYVGPNITERVYPGLYSVFRPGLGGRISAYKYASVLAETARNAGQVQGLRDRLAKDPTMTAAWANSPMKEVLKKAATVNVHPDEVKPGAAHPLVDAFIRRDGPDTGVELITKPGLYHVEGISGRQYKGYVYPTVMNFDLQKQDVMVFVGRVKEEPKPGDKNVPAQPYYGGEYGSVQQSIAGKACSDSDESKETSRYGAPGQTGVFFIRKGSVAVAFIPVKIISKTRMNENRKMNFEKDHQNIELTKNFEVQKFTVQDSFGVRYHVVISPLVTNVSKLGDMVLMPADTSFSSLGTLVTLKSEAGQLKKVAAGPTVTVKHLGGESFAVDCDWAEGWMKEGDLKNRLQEHLSQYYTNESLEKVFAEAKKTGRVNINNRMEKKFLAPVHKHEYREAHKIARDLTKIAAHLPDPGLVDTVLSLQFINKDNINKFISFIPQFEQAASHLADLLIASRLGLDVPEYPVKTAMENMADVISELRMMRGK